MSATLVFFPTKSSAGIELAEVFRPLAEGMGFKVKIKEALPFVLAQAVFYADIVVFDGTIEGKQSNYSAGVEMLSRVNHGLIVSRTPLPLNTPGQWEGGAPLYPHVFSNEQILAWLKQTLKQVLPRPLREKVIPYFASLNSSLQWRLKHIKQQAQIFVSYRSAYHKDIIALNERVKQGDFHTERDKELFFFAPGTLAFEDEILAPFRRWVILSIIREYIEDCEEFWIYDSEEYLDSWWTQGELATLFHSWGRDLHKIRIFDPERQTLRTPSSDEFFQLADEQSRRMTRWFVNTDPVEMGPESALLWRRRAFDSRIRLLPNISSFRDNMQAFADDPVWKDAFWENLVMQCQSEICRAAAARQRDAFHFDIDAFLFTQGPNFFTIDPQQMEAALKGEAVIVCPNCQSTYHFKRELRDRYLALALPVGQSAESSCLLNLPVYRPIADLQG